MKVKELIEHLTGMDPEAEVIVQKDAEGNGYSPLYVVDDAAIYVPETTWSGDVFNTTWSAEDADMDPEEWKEFLVQNKRCVVLAPTN